MSVRYTYGVLRAFTGVFLSVAIASAADFSGIWTGIMPDRNGDLQDLSFRFAQHDGVLTGKMYGDNESVPITDGKVNGDQITFVVTTELNGSISKVLFTGTLVNGEIQAVRAKADAPSGKAAVKPVPDKPNPKQTFVLKRL